MDSPSTISLTFIGGGVLATSIITGILDDKQTVRESHIRYDISITARREEHARSLRQRYPQAYVTTNNRDPGIWKPRYTASGDQVEPTARIILICTQPQYTSTICEDMHQVMNRWNLQPRPVFVTMCPGITVRQLEGWLKTPAPIVRTMPNTPVSVKQGATAIFASRTVSQMDVQEVIALFRPISPAVCVLPREDLLDVSASISGSAPAYFFAFMDMLIEAAVARGMPHEIAMTLVKQCATGSALLAHSSDASLSSLLGDVCVPGGSTEKAIACLNDRGLSETIDAAVERSLVANKAMGTELDA